MKQVKLGLVVAALIVGGAACGDDATDNNKSNNATNNATSNATSNSTNNGPNNTSNGTNNVNNTNNTTTNNTTGTNNPPNNNMMITVPSCTDATPPPRCAEDPTAVTWATSSIIDDFFVEGTEDEPICCYDYGGPDDEIDNSLGQNLAGFGFLADINTSIADSIAAGTLALVLEHDGLEDLANDDDFTINFFIAQHEDEAAFEANGFDPAGGNAVLIDPASFEMGAHPQALLPDASATAGAVTAGPGAVKIEIELFDSPLQLTISRARTDVSIDAANSDLDPTVGVALQGGELGGVVKIRDIFVAVNEFAEGSCACLELNGAPLVDVDSGMCSQDANVQNCEDMMEDTCAEVAGACNLFGAVGLFADVDLDGDGLNESVSIGATYTAVGATINGIAP